MKADLTARVALLATVALLALCAIGLVGLVASDPSFAIAQASKDDDTFSDAYRTGNPELSTVGVFPDSGVFTESVTWYQAEPEQSPPDRRFHAMAYDSARGRVVLFGGDDDGENIGDTWEWDGSHWMQRFSDPSPSARFGHAMVYDIARGVIVLFGGKDIDNLNDTWEWDGTDWVQRFPAMSPPTRRGHAMVYDKERGVVVLFGGWGQAGGGYMNDTWEWNGANWAQRTPTTIPSSRSGHALAYDNLHNRVVLFGGRNPTPLNDTWEWNGADWVRQNPISLPPARYRHAMAYDDTRERVVVFGGNDGSNDLNDTWEWNGADWTQAVPATSPPERTYHAVAYDSIRRCLVLFGGSDDDQQFDDTWEYRFLSLSVSPATQTVVRGQTASFPGSVEGTLSSVTLTVVALPGGVSGQFLPSSPLTPPVQITLVLTTSFVTSDGVHPVILVGQAAGLTTSVPLTLEVTPSYYVFLPFVLSGDHTKAQSSPTARCTNER